MIKAKIVGATGYGGMGIAELLMRHPEAETACLVDLQDVGKKLSDVYPHLAGFCDLEVIDPQDPLASEPVDVVFFSTPDRVGMKLARAELERGAKVIDYSGDFRFNTVALYEDYATRLGLDPVHESPDLLEESVYGLPELHRVEIAESRLVGNVGCFASSVILGMTPAVALRLVDPKTLISDSKTGVSGAGKTPAPVFHFPARLDHMNAYRLTGHQHTCEIEKELSRVGGESIEITLTTQVVPASRGILSCLYGKLREPMSYDAVLEAYREFHQDNPFIRVYDRNAAVGTMHVRGTNFCNLVVDVDERTQTLRVISHIDNLVKGQAGNALQNMNLMFGFDENTALDRPGQYP